MSWIAIPLSGLTVLATLAGGSVALRLRHSLPTVIALTGGVVVAVALFDVLPEGINLIDDANRATTLVAIGFLAFFFAERALTLHHRDDPSEARAHSHVGMFGALGLSIHSFIDGLGIGLAFGLDATTGMLVFVAVISHDFADGMNTVSFVLSQSGDQNQGAAGCGSTPSRRFSGRSSAPWSASPTPPSATSSASIRASSSTWGQPTCCPRRTPTPPGAGSP